MKYATDYLLDYLKLESTPETNRLKTLGKLMEREAISYLLCTIFDEISEKAKQSIETKDGKFAGLLEANDIILKHLKPQVSEQRTEATDISYKTA